MSDSPSPKRRKKTESKVEIAKRESNLLRGSIKPTLDGDASHFEESDMQLLKFHGIYQQDNRDIRSELKAAGKEPDYSFMVRIGLTGGYASAEQYLKIDDLADICADGTLRITTRQGIQYHGVRKGDLQTLMRGLNDKLMTTLAACGDVSRNVMATPLDGGSPALRRVREIAKEIAIDLRPQSRAYYEIWLNGEKVQTSDQLEAESFYGQQYLPRKFKCGVALATDNSIDLYSYDSGLIAVVEEDRLIGLQVIAGGGFGMTHNKPNTIAALAQPVAFVAPEYAVAAVRTIAAIFRDHGNRIDRKQARLKYLIRDWGIEKFREEFRSRVDFPIEPPRDLPRPGFQDYLGPQPQADGTLCYGLFIENGRVKDSDERRERTGIRTVVETLGCDVIFTANQNLVFTGLSPDSLDELEAILRDHGLRLLDDLSTVRRYSMACPALPTCGLALTESERVMPEVVDDFEELLASLGLEDEALTLRMTGCPNGCARPYTAEIGLVGRKPGQSYNIYVGGSISGDRMAELFAEDVPMNDLKQTLRPLLAAFAKHRGSDETFSDYYLRVAGRKEPNRQLSGKETPTREQISLPVV
jgi:sulfite reductase (ferredoxin)